jgi:hypothetical protein
MPKGAVCSITNEQKVPSRRSCLRGPGYGQSEQPFRAVTVPEILEELEIYTRHFRMKATGVAFEQRHFARPRRSSAGSAGNGACGSA